MRKKNQEGIYNKILNQVLVDENSDFRLLNIHTKLIKFQAQQNVSKDLVLLRPASFFSFRLFELILFQ